MKRIAPLCLSWILLLLAGCSLPSIGGNGGAEPIADTPDYSGLAFDTPTGIRTPSPLPSETVTPTVTRDRGWIPSPTPEPTHNPFRWTCVPDGSPDPCHRVLRDISMLPSGDGWAVGEQGAILRRAGGEWESVASPVPSTIRRVFALGTRDAWAVVDDPYAIGPGDYRFRSRLLRWDGSAWSIFTTDEPLGYVVDLSFLTERFAWGIAFEDYGEGRVFHLIRWNGRRWEALYDTPVLNAIQMVSASSGWAVGDGGAIFYWNGIRWSAVESPTDADLDGVAFSSPGSGWATGRGGVILRYALGEWWEYSALAPSPRVMAVDPDGGDGWMLGSWNRGDIVLRWDGSDWVPFAGETPDGEALALDFPSVGEAWAAGWVPGRSRAGMIWRWDGSSWNRDIDKIPIPLLTADFLTADDGWGAGEDGQLVHWDGTGWHAAESPTWQTLNAVAMLSADDGWAAGEGGQVLRWDGEQWSVWLPYRARGIGSRALYFQFNALAFPSPADGWSAGGLEGGDFGQPWIEHWDGADWEEVRLFDDEPPCRCSLYAMHFSAPDDGWAVGGGDEMLILHWDGTEWTWRTWPEAYRLLAVGGAASDDLWAAGVAENLASNANPGVILHWDGEQWVPYPIPPGAAWMSAIHMDAADDGWMAGSGLIHWNGSEWGTVPLPQQAVIIKLARTPDGVLWAVTDTGSVLRLEGG
jgi:hypothetical protein